ncbi:MAG: hypothetical protein AAGH65_06135 [Pseudomonadota bacterium]
MSEFTLGLALFDCVPVILTAVAVHMLVGMVRDAAVPNAWVSAVGATLIVLGGACKASWKLNLVLTSTDSTWLANLLFPLMAPGFALLCAGVWLALRSRRGQSTPGWFWAVAIGLIAVTSAAALAQQLTSDAVRAWFQPVLSLASLSNITLTVLLVSAAIARRQWLLGGLFLVNLAMVFVLIPISQIEPMTVQVHWFEQSLTSVGSAAFALASLRLRVLLALATPHTETTAQANLKRLPTPDAMA